MEPCKPLNDESKSRPWSKYSKESSSYKKANGIKEDPKAKKKEAAAPKEKKPSVIEKLLGDLKDDEQFKEFVAASKAISAKDGIWKNDIALDAASTELIKTKPEKKASKKAAVKVVSKEDDVEFESGDDSDNSDSDVFDVTKALEAKKNKKKLGTSRTAVTRTWKKAKKMT